MSKSTQTCTKLWKPAVLGVLTFFLIGMLATVVSVVLDFLVLSELLPRFFVAFSIATMVVARIVLPYVQQLYFLVLSVKQYSKVRQSLEGAVKIFVPYLHVLIFIVMKSYLWLTIVGAPLLFIGLLKRWPALLIVGGLCAIAGMILGIIRGPRLSLVSVILVKRNEGGRKSVDESWRVTQGYWGKIVGNSMLLGLCVLGIIAGLFSFMSFVFVSFGALKQMIGVIAAGITIVLCLLIALIVTLGFISLAPLFLNVFRVHLFETISLHPRNRQSSH